MIGRHARLGALLALGLAWTSLGMAQRGVEPVRIRVGLTQSNGSVKVESLPLEDYVARVLAAEGQPRAGDAAQQALAIAVRTFALANRHRHRSEGYDLCDTTHCQVVRAATDTSRRAALATAGRVLVYQGQPALIFYSAWCGGRSELASEVWPGAINYPFEPAQKDEACKDEPGWTSEIRAQDLARALRAAGLEGARLRDLEVIKRNGSGRVSRVRARGFTPDEISGHDFRMAVVRVAGAQGLKSTAFELHKTSAGYRFEGRGYGHGVGLCVVGAGNRAARGDTAEEILRFYFPGLRVEQYTSVATTIDAPAVKAPAPRAGGTSRAADVVVALPETDARERDAVLQLVRRARDEIARKTGVSVPAAIQVTIHPSVESFGRATGQPWWVSGATDGTAIDLPPIALLRQRGQLDRIIGQEVAHVLLDPALSQRPLWVREGAAGYFASAAPLADRPARVDCPSDDEFTRPLSAGAHRDAYARAEACFRRQIAAGRSWKDVR